MTNKEIQLSEITITLQLPDNFGDGWDYDIVYYYPKSHAWAGSYNRADNRNWAFDALFEDMTPKPIEHCSCPIYPWVKFNIDIGHVDSIQNEVEKITENLQVVVAKFSGTRNKRKFPLRVKID